MKKPVNHWKFRFFMLVYIAFGFEIWNNTKTMRKISFIFLVIVLDIIGVYFTEKKSNSKK